LLSVNSATGLGRVSWFENARAANFKEHCSQKGPEPSRAQVYDLNKDGRPDIFVLMGQAREGLYLFLNEGQGKL